MGTHDEILRWFREQERILGPIREFNKLYDRDLFSIVTESMERERQFQSSLGDLPTSYQQILNNLQPELERMSHIDTLTKEAKAVADAHGSLSLQLSRYALPDFDVIAAIKANPSWAPIVEQYSALSGCGAASDLALKSHFASIAESSFLAQERMLQVYPGVLGLTAGFESADLRGLRDASSLLAEEYRILIRSFEDNRLLIASLPPIVSSGPSVELLTSAKLLGSLSRVDYEDMVETCDSPEEQELLAEIEASVDELLAELNADLQTMWLGAKQAFRSNNPDRVRHVVVSLRELVGHVLRFIAPDEQVKSWTTKPEHFHEGSPTRAARVLYVCRGINHGPFAKFVAADVKASIECIRLFQRGTHELTIDFSECQLRTLFLRTESLLRFLLYISRTAV